MSNCVCLIVYADRHENFMLWLSTSFMKLYIQILSFFGRAPNWREIESIVTSHEDRLRSFSYVIEWLK